MWHADAHLQTWMLWGLCPWAYSQCPPDPPHFPQTSLQEMHAMPHDDPHCLAASGPQSMSDTGAPCDLLCVQHLLRHCSLHLLQQLTGSVELLDAYSRQTTFSWCSAHLSTASGTYYLCINTDDAVAMCKSWCTALRDGFEGLESELS